jgi:hypothetical protein
MPDREAPARAVYDHTEEEPRPAGRRRRQVADWGVGEELFDGMPGRRFERRTEHRIPRGGADDGRRTIVISEAETTVEPEIADEEFASREEALRARREHDAVWAGDEPFATDEESLVGESVEDARGGPLDNAGGSFGAAAESFGAARGGSLDNAGGSFGAAAESFGAAPESLAAAGTPPAFDDVVAPRHERAPEGMVRGGVEGRRTVKIGGRPPEFHSAPARRRAVHERVGPRPDRIAAWAFALGLLLILIAIVT